MIHSLPTPKTTKKAKIVGRGQGSGKGSHTTGKGMKGQKSRTGYRKPRPNFEGGQNPLSRRLPTLKGPTARRSRKRGFIESKEVNAPVQLSKIAEGVKAGDTINVDTLLDLQLVRLQTNKDTNIKVVFDKEIDKKLIFEGIKATKKATEAIQKAGGEVR